MTYLNIFRYQTFVAVSGKPSVKNPVKDDVLSSHEQEIFPITSLDENSIEFELRTDPTFTWICDKHILLQ